MGKRSPEYNQAYFMSRPGLKFILCLSPIHSQIEMFVIKMDHKLSHKFTIQQQRWEMLIEASCPLRWDSWFLDYSLLLRPKLLRSIMERRGQHPINQSAIRSSKRFVDKSTLLNCVNEFLWKSLNLFYARYSSSNATNLAPLNTSNLFLEQSRIFNTESVGSWAAKYCRLLLAELITPY